jgi:hypothetical protein
LAVAALAYAPAAAADAIGTSESRAVADRLAAEAAPSDRAVQSTIDAYLSSARADATLVGGAGSAGYDGGFWIRGGSFLLKLNLTLQTRWEGFDWDKKANEANPGGDLSGFSLPRVTLKFSGDATCDIHYYAELEFGHAGMVMESMLETVPMAMMMGAEAGMVEFASDPGICREAWIEYEAAPQLAFRMGLLKTATTRQLMTPPEYQQFVDVSLAAASVGSMMPGYTDRNRDYGFMVHGALGCDGAWSYLATVTNGDGPVHRNVLDGTTNDNLAYSARVNWDILGHMGYEECALNHHSCEWTAAVGAWGHAYSDVIADNAHATNGMSYNVGVDAALGYGGFSFCGAYTYSEWMDGTDTSSCWCVQAGYLFPGTAWEVAARYSLVTMDMGTGIAKMTEGAHEFGFAVNYFIDGHADKVTADVSFISADDDGNMFGDVYAGYEPTGTGDGVLLRLQWQLAL